LEKVSSEFSPSQGYFTLNQPPRSLLELLQSSKSTLLELKDLQQSQTNRYWIYPPATHKDPVTSI